MLDNSELFLAVLIRNAGLNADDVLTSIEQVISSNALKTLYHRHQREKYLTKLR